MIDLKIRMNHADGLMRKMWSQLEKPCREEGVKRYQIEASSPVTPAKVKQPTELQRARARVVEILKEEEQKKAKEKEDEEMRQLEKAQIPVKESEALQEGTVSHPVGDTEGDKEELMEVQESAGEDRNPEVKTSKTSDPGLAEGSTAGEDMIQKPGGGTYQEKVAGEQEIVRVKKQKWTPDQGFRRCGHQCPGCAQKCAEQGIEDCQNCHLNKTKKKNNNPCANRGECVDPRPATMQKPKTSGKQNSKVNVSLKEENLERKSSTTSLVGNQVEELVKKIEKNGVEEEEDDPQQGEKRPIEVGGTPEEQRRASKIAKSKTGGGSKIALPAKMQNLIK